MKKIRTEEPFVDIDFLPCAVGEHPRLPQYFAASVLDEALPLSFRCVAGQDECIESVAIRAEAELEAKAEMEGAWLLSTTLVATWRTHPRVPTRRIFRAMVIACEAGRSDKRIPSSRARAIHAP